MTLSAPHVRWLSLIRYQVMAAVEQSRQPMPLAMLAINGLHDAVEAMLGLVAEHRSVAVKGRDFVQLLDTVLGDVSAVGHHRTSLIALNNARVGFKHHGNVLDEMSVERHRVGAENFLTDITTEALGENFDAISITGFIIDKEARRRVEAAETVWAGGDGPLAMARLRLAFERLIEDYEKRKTWMPGRTLFTTRPLHPPTGHGVHDDRRMNYVEAWLDAIDKRMKLLTFGVDVRRYVYLDAHAPRASVLRGMGALSLGMVCRPRLTRYSVDATGSSSTRRCIWRRRTTSSTPGR
ncbi:MAG: hypothetical protein ACRDRI_12565 [Pseudonocardiaceae bacterium]